MLLRNVGFYMIIEPPRRRQIFAILVWGKGDGQSQLDSGGGVRFVQTFLTGLGGYMEHEVMYLDVAGMGRQNDGNDDIRVGAALCRAGSYPGFRCGSNLGIGNGDNRTDRAEVYSPLHEKASFSKSEFHSKFRFHVDILGRLLPWQSQNISKNIYSLR